MAQVYAGRKDCAEQNLPPYLLNAYRSVLELKIRDGLAVLQQPESPDVGHPFAIYLESLAVALQTGIASDPLVYENNVKLERRLLDQVDRVPEDSPYRLYLTAEIRLHWSVIKLKYGHEFSAFWTMKQAYAAAEKLQSTYPDFKPGLKIQAIMDVLFGSVPDQYRWITGLFGLTGNLDQGIASLKEILNDDDLFAYEAGIWLSLIQAYMLEQFEEATCNASMLLRKMPESLLIAYISASVLMKNAQSDSALHVLQKFQPLSRDYVKFPHLHYMKGEINLQKGYYERAIDAYTHFIEQHKGPNLIKDSYYKMAICYHLLDMEGRSQACCQLARTNGTADTEVDKNAEYLLSEGHMPQKKLAMVRYHTDGGFFEQAFNVLETIQPRELATLKDSVEYMYRYARLYHKTLQTAKSVFYYCEVLKKQADNSWYFAPNSCLQLAHIYYAEEQPGRAVDVLHKLQQYKGYPYAGSIRKKADVLEEKINKEQ